MRVDFEWEFEFEHERKLIWNHVDYIMNWKAKELMRAWPYFEAFLSGLEQL